MVITSYQHGLLSVVHDINLIIDNTPFQILDTDRGRHDKDTTFPVSLFHRNPHRTAPPGIVFGPGARAHARGEQRTYYDANARPLQPSWKSTLFVANPNL